MTPAVEKTPLATYRLQLTAAFGFDQAAAAAQYLADLGVSHLYSSPVLQAGKGSTHGYDVVDHNRVNLELGGDEGFDRLCEALGAAGLGQVLDIVPNHMAIVGGQNLLWWDVLENGRASRHARYFDIDWDAAEERFRSKVLMPVLGDRFGRVLDKGELQIRRDGSAFRLHYYDNAFPLAPESVSPLLATAAKEASSRSLEMLAGELSRLPAGQQADPLERHRIKEMLLGQLSRLLRSEPVMGAAVDRAIAVVNADREALDALLSRQHFRLSYWRLSGSELNYRRFFAVDTLVGIRVELPQVFLESHSLILDWVRRGVIDGLRVDHPDGLRDPLQYLRRLRQEAPHAWIVVEKILEPGETLPESWPVQGTTGYDFLNQVGGLFVDPAGEGPFSDFYRQFTGQAADCPAVVRQNKLKLLRESFGGEVSRLTHMLVTIAEGGRESRDFTRDELREALRELLADFPVYRTYIRADGRSSGDGPAPIGEVSNADRQCILAAVDAARGYRPDLDSRLMEFIQDLLTLRNRGELQDDFVMRFQQLSGPAMAKGVEDTTFYCFNRLISLNEVGGDPGRFGIGANDFHEYSRHLLRHWPQTMLTTSTHDTKRGEDTRLRISALSEIPGEWFVAVKRWSAMNEGLGARDEAKLDRNTEYFIYQTLVGAWPIEKDRLTAYMIKAVREAKMHTSWTDPVASYEEAVSAFIEGVLANERFKADLEAFIEPIIAAARVSSLSQTLIKYTAPGVPDCYQGTELWNLSLVDPDNRRPVDFGVRKRLLDELMNGPGRPLSPAAGSGWRPSQAAANNPGGGSGWRPSQAAAHEQGGGQTSSQSHPAGEAQATCTSLSAADVMARMDEALPKMFLIRRALEARRRRPELFGPDAAYRPLGGQGQKERHLVAFLRGEAAATVAPHLTMQLGHWGDTQLHLPRGRWVNEFTGDAVEQEKVRVGELLRQFPVALLIRER